MPRPNADATVPEVQMLAREYMGRFLRGEPPTEPESVFASTGSLKGAHLDDEKRDVIGNGPSSHTGPNFDLLHQLLARPEIKPRTRKLAREEKLDLFDQLTDGGSKQSEPYLEVVWKAVQSTHDFLQRVLNFKFGMHDCQAAPDRESLAKILAQQLTDEERTWFSKEFSCDRADVQFSAAEVDVMEELALRKLADY